MNGAFNMLDLVHGQKTDLFFDQRFNHAFVARLAKNSHVLKMFYHIGGFSLAALTGNTK